MWCHKDRETAFTDRSLALADSMGGRQEVLFYCKKRNKDSCYFPNLSKVFKYSKFKEENGWNTAEFFRHQVEKK